MGFSLAVSRVLSRAHMLALTRARTLSLALSFTCTHALFLSCSLSRLVPLARSPSIARARARMLSVMLCITLSLIFLVCLARAFSLRPLSCCLFSSLPLFLPLSHTYARTNAHTLPTVPDQHTPPDLVPSDQELNWEKRTQSTLHTVCLPHTGCMCGQHSCMCGQHSCMCGQHSCVPPAHARTVSAPGSRLSPQASNLQLLLPAPAKYC